MGMSEQLVFSVNLTGSEGSITHKALCVRQNAQIVSLRMKSKNDIYTGRQGELVHVKLGYTHTHTHIADIGMNPRYSCTHGETEVNAWWWCCGQRGLAVKCWFCEWSREVDGYIQRDYIHPYCSDREVYRLNPGDARCEDRHVFSPVFSFSC